MGRCSDARDRLLASASRLMRERGYTAMSVQDICQDAGLKKGSFYHFFPSKRDLVLASLEEHAERYARLLAQVDDTAGCVKDQLRSLFAALRETSMGEACPSCPVAMLAMEMSERDEALASKVRDVFELLRSGVETLLRRGVERAELDLDPRQISEVLVVYLQGALLWAKTLRDPAVLERLQSGFETLIEGAAPQPPSVRE